MLLRASKWINPGLRLHAADLIGLPLRSCGDHCGALQYQLKTIRTHGRAWPYAVWSPPGDVAAPLPVILFLHGAGERGSDGQAPTQVGLGPALWRFPHLYPAHVVMPQCPIGSQWSGPAERVALHALDATIAQRSGDERRIYVTGVSMGGHGALRLAAHHPSRFAAVVAICGWADTNETAPRLKGVPVWLFHGASDPVVPARCSVELATALRSAGARSVRHTEYPEIGHECWDRAYADAQLSEWIFRHSR